MKTLTFVTLLLVSSGLLAQPGPGSSWGEIERNPMYQAEVPSIPFVVQASTGIGSAVILRRAHEVCHYQQAPGRAGLDGGLGRICTAYDEPTDQRERTCISYETVELKRPLAYRSPVCLLRSDDDCLHAKQVEHQFALNYQVKVVSRASRSDDFSFARPAAFYKPLTIAACNS